MDELSKRLAALSPEQRELLEARLRKQGLRSSAAAPAEAPAAAAAREPGDAGGADWKDRPAARGMGFSLYFFSGDGSKASDDKYRLVLEGARFADRRGFSAVWTPERHFQDFGGLYPNPSVLSAALAVITERVQIRAGSVALPLHHPVRVAEEWSVVDNLSRGRVAVSFASGWHPDDFIFAPGAYDERREVMFRHIELIQKLWAGGRVRLPGAGGSEVEVGILPRPVQPALPVWVTSSGSPETWSRAGAIGANVLAAYVGYTPDELARRVGLYREARRAHGHDPRGGVVTVMLHTFVGDDDEAVRERVRAPFSAYLRAYFRQYETTGADAGGVTEADKDALMEAAFEKYFEASTLMGSQSKCARLIDALAGVGVDEVACLIDFGLDDGSVLDGLARLDELRAHYAPAA
ncbi:MAG TPA: LLM class flavin-dependent oxidoreductase [Pyrinomonadaceae bacterium]|jgi:natural product biosynthesis luciferase-like monooxygenase protein